MDQLRENDTFVTSLRSDPVNMRLNDDLVSSLREALSRGEGGLRSIPLLLAKLLDEDRWKSRIVAQTNAGCTYSDFNKFVTDPPLDGLGANLNFIRNIIKDNPTLLAKWDSLTVGGPGNPNPSGNNQYTYKEVIDNNIINYPTTRNSPVGTSKQKGLRELSQKRSDLLERVERGELSVHRANVEAGFRPRTLTIRLEVDAAASALKRHFSQEDLQRLKGLL